jgi:hypothetical protein
VKVIPYNAKHKEAWNEFLKKSKNSTFLFHRSFLEYHADRFTDHSLIAIDDKDKIVGLLPGNLTNDNILISHEGLTYGGFIIEEQAKLLTVIRIVHSILKFLHERKIFQLKVKQLPSFYLKTSEGAIAYTFFLINALLYRRDVALLVDLQNRIPYSGNIRREGNKAERSDGIIVEDDTFDQFWECILAPQLIKRYGVKPVHTLDEIKLLKRNFPDAIKQYNVYFNGTIVAGATMFITEHVAHCQYISSNDEGRKNGCLNYLFKNLLDNVFARHRYFDFGIVNEDEGRLINKGMLFWKEAFGGRSFIHDFYSIETSSFQLLEAFLDSI